MAEINSSISGRMVSFDRDKKSSRSIWKNMSYVSIDEGEVIEHHVI